MYPGNEVNSGWKSEGRGSVLVIVELVVDGSVGVSSNEAVNRFSTYPFLAVVRSFHRDALLNAEQDEAAVVQALLLEQELGVGVVGDWCGHELDL